jgi:hypothetical protein
MEFFKLISILLLGALITDVNGSDVSITRKIFHGEMEQVKGVVSPIGRCGGLGNLIKNY